MRVVGAKIHRYRGAGDVTIPIGAATVLIGPNGSGKTSLLKTLGFADDPTMTASTVVAPQQSVSYYLGAEKRGNRFSLALRDALNAHTTGDESAARTAVGSLTKHLCVCVHPDGRRTIALDLFRLLIDESENHRLATQRRLSAELGKVTENPWAVVAIEALTGPLETIPLFVDLALPIDLATPVLTAASFVSLPDEISPVLTARLEEIMRTVFAEVIADRLDVRDAVNAVRDCHLGPAHEAGLLGPVRRALQAEANLIAPSFLSRHGEITLGVNTGPQSPIAQVDSLLLDILAVADGPEVARLVEQAQALLRPYGDTVDLHLDTDVVPFGQDATAAIGAADGAGRHNWDYRELGTGMRRWICGVIDEACRNIIDRWRHLPLTLEEFDLMAGEADLPPRPAPDTPIRLRLIDEPVENLEGRSQTEVLGWLRSLLVDGSESLVVATHHPSLLKVSGNDELVVIAVNWVDGQVMTHAMGPALLNEFERLFAQLEISPEELLFLARSLLIVEGADDLGVLSAIYGEQLRERGVMLHSAAGSDHRSIVNAFTQSAYRLLRIPTWALLDSTYDETSGVKRRCAYGKGSNNHKVLTKVSEELEALGHSLRVVPFEPHDIAAGLHPHIYRRVFPRSKVPANLAEYEAAIAKCKTGKETKALIATWIFGEAKAEKISFSQDVIAKVCDAITADRIGVGAATPWLRSAMDRLFDDLAAVDTPKKAQGGEELG